MFWWRFTKKIPFAAKRRIAQNRDKPWQEARYTFIGKVGAEAILMVNWAKPTLKIGDVALALFSRWFGMALVCGYDGFDIWF